MIYDANGNVQNQNNCEDVRSYGAVGDGITNDTPALKYAFLHAKNIYLPRGTYLIDRTLFIPDNTKIIGDGKQSIIKLAGTYNLSGYPWRDDYKYPIIYVGANCILRDFLINGDETAARDQGQVGVWVSGNGTICYNVHTKNINYFPDAWIGGASGYGTVNAPGYGFLVHYCKNIIIDSCSFDGNGYEGIGTEGTENVIIKNCFVGAGNRTGIQIHRYSKNIIIENCIVDNPNTYKHADLTIHGDSEPIDKIKIIGCSFITACEEKASIQTVTGLETNVLITGCHFNSNNLAISTKHDNIGQGGSENVIIVGNIIKSRKDGVSAYGENVIVTDNIVEYVENGISVYGESNVIENNINIQNTN